MAVGSNSTFPYRPHPLLFHLLSYSLTDRRGHLDEVSQEVSATAAAGLIDTAGRGPLSAVFCTISQNWGKCHSPALSSDREGGAGGEGGLVPVASGDDVCLMTR